MGVCTLAQQFLSLKKPKAFPLMHGLECRNGLVEKELDNDASKEKKLECVIVGNLES